jgi:hypothetical protein
MGQVTFETTAQAKGETKHEGGLVNGVENFLHAAAYGAIQTPIDGVTQFVDHVTPGHLPHLELVSKPTDDSLWTSAGKFAGAVFDFAVLQKVLGSAAPKVFGAESTLPVWARAGATGAAYQALMPVSENGNYFLNKTRDVGIGFGVFAAMGAVTSYAAPRLGNSFVGRVEAGAEAAMSDLLYWQKPGVRDLEKIGKYTAFGATLAATSYFEDDLKTRWENAKKSFEQANSVDQPNQVKPETKGSENKGPETKGPENASVEPKADAKVSTPEMTVEQSVANSQAVFNNSEVVPATKQLYEVKFRKVVDPAGEKVPTLENPAGETVQQGHWIAQRLDASGQPVIERGQINQWPIATDAKVAKTYNVDPETLATKTEFVAPTRVDSPPVHVVKLTKPITIQTSWGSMEGKPGDWLANYDFNTTTNTPGSDYAIISGTSFDQTYKAQK